METRHRGPAANHFCVYVWYSCAIMPQNCSVPYCTKKVYEENGVKFLFISFQTTKLCSGNGLLQCEEISG